MSFLEDLIKSARKSIEHDSEHSVRHFMQEIINALDRLHEKNNLRVFDGNSGGVVRGPRLSRAKYESPETGNLLCQEEHFNKNKLEVPYFRAVFNSSRHVLRGKLDPKLQIYMIGYESPLMRQKENRKGSRNLSRAVSCDLVGLTSDNRILCIEGKVNPKNSSTDLVYGLLESFAYGLCANYFLSTRYRDHFVKEILACVEEFHPKKEISVDEEKVSAAFSLAAPQKYFAEYFSPTELSDRKANKRLGEAEKLLEVLQSIESPEWAGFLVLDPPCSESNFERKGRKEVNGKQCIEPHLKPDASKFALAKDIDDLRRLHSLG